MKNTPTDWRRELLRTVCHRTEQWIPDKEPRGSFYYIDVSSVSNATYSLKDPVLVRADNAPGRARKILKWQDTIYATIRPSLKRVAFITKEYDGQIASTAFCVVRPDKKMAFPLYVYFFLLSDFVNRKIVELQHGASYPAVTDKDVLNQTIPLPPLPEQQKIAAILFKIQQAIQLQESIIERMQELKKATMQHVFTHGLRGEKTKETEVGRMPESWDVNSLSSFAMIEMGQSPEGENYNKCGEGIPLLNGPAEFTKKYPRPVQWTSKPTKLAKAGDILFCVRGNTVARMNIADQDYCIGRGIAAIRGVLNQSITEFISYIIEYNANRIYIYATAGGSTFPNFSKSDFDAIYMPKPSVKEQIEIAHILQAIDKKIELHTAKKSALQDLFKTMLNKLMTGEIRVKDLEMELLNFTA